MKIYFALLFLTIVTLGCHNATSDSETKKNVTSEAGGANKLLTVKAMQGDLAVLWDAIKELHPGYGFYTSPMQLQEAFDKVYASIKSPLSESQFMDLVYPFLCQLRCGHTQLKHSATFKQSADEKTPHLPFEVLVRNHRAWITRHKTAALNTGDEILDINGTPVAAIIDKGYGLYCGDGYGETFKELFLSEYDGFEDACNKCYHWPGRYQMQLRTANGILKNITVKSADNGVATAGQQLKTVDNFANWVVASHIPDARLRFLKNTSTAWFSAPPFAYADTTIYKDAFAALAKKGIKNLILDLRHNTGGDIRIATQLLSYLADAPFNIVKDVKARIPNLAENRFIKHFDTTITKGFVLGYKTGNKETGGYHIDATPAFGQIYGPFQLAEKNHFNGNLVVLIDGATFSSGALFTAALKAQRNGVKFVGRETAGAEEGCNGVTIQKLTLPDTKIEVDFPWMHVVSVAKSPVKGRGIMPNYNIEYGPEDVVSQTDLDLKKAVSLIGESERHR